jgi:hypothetical protein
MTDALERLAGDWEIEMSADGEVVARELITSEWIGDREFLLHRGTSELTDAAPEVWRENAPRSSSMLFGADDPSGRFACLYADSRGVKRVYEMSLDDNGWLIWGRSGPAFFQRFFGAFNDAGDRIDARWERSEDGDNWELDFEATYKRR